MNAILEKYSIIVDIPAPAEEVFIAIPFSKEFEQVQATIERACPRVGFKPSATNIKQETSGWLDDIKKMTRRARVVVAVCSPETSTQKPNPNVMYELGFAASIGKATVILTSDIKTLPADIQDQNVLLYNPRQVDSKEFLNELILAIIWAKDRASNHATDSSIIDVRFAGVQDWTYTDPDGWRNYVEVLRFAKAVHTVFQTLIEPLNSVFDSIPAGADTGAVKATGTCDRAFSNYCRQQKTQFQSIIGLDWVEIKEKKSDAMNKLSISSITKPLLGEVPDFHEKVIIQIDSYRNKLESLVSWVEKDGGLVKLLRQSSGTFAADIRELSGYASYIVMDADALIVNLIEMLPRGNKHE